MESRHYSMPIPRRRPARPGLDPFSLSGISPVFWYRSILSPYRMRRHSQYMVGIEKTVFLSYRRINVSWALAIFQSLTHDGYDVFFDFDGLASAISSA
jgi:hypothetical protein